MKIYWLHFILIKVIYIISTLKWFLLGWNFTMREFHIQSYQMLAKKIWTIAFIGFQIRTMPAAPCYCPPFNRIHLVIQMHKYLFPNEIRNKLYAKNLTKNNAQHFICSLIYNSKLLDSFHTTLLSFDVQWKKWYWIRSNATWICCRFLSYYEGYAAYVALQIHTLSEILHTRTKIIIIAVFIL